MGEMKAVGRIVGEATVGDRRVLTSAASAGNVSKRRDTKKMYETDTQSIASLVIDCSAHHTRLGRDPIRSRPHHIIVSMFMVKSCQTSS